MKPNESRFKRDENQHLQETMDIIHGNIAHYEQRVIEVKQETDELNDKITPRDRELNSQMFIQLSISTAMLEHVSNELRKNKAAADKAYFGRIDYQETKSGLEESLYIGKNGVQTLNGEIVIVDWRAPVSTVYYENENGLGSYAVPESDPMEIELFLKRTFDIENGIMNGYYDSDVASNDQLLVKYLAKNKDVVLGDIIATIQKEQNQIIRDIPFKSMIVQGVAGSGKTTVAMHRISHILYNYEKRYAPEDFCIIGSNDMLLNYITSGLPELDVKGIKQRRMDEFLKEQLYEDWKKKYKLIPADAGNSWKCRMDYVRVLESYLQNVWLKLLKPRTIKDSEIGVILSRDQMYDILRFRRDWSLKRIEVMLNETILRRIRLLTDYTVDDDEYEFYKALKRRKLKEYKNYFKVTKEWFSCMETYQRFVKLYSEKYGYDATETLDNIERGRLDVYDLAAMAVVRRWISEDMLPNTFGQIIIDEAQDFGEMIYYVLKRLQPGCYFTIMGDVSQNIHYEMGMNDWEPLREFVFNEKNDSFQILAKSYRNTIEISEYAGRVLEKASAGAYKIEPVIRHGEPVAVHQVEEAELLPQAAKLTAALQEKGFHTVAVICRNQEEADKVQKGLEKLGIATTGSKATKEKVVDNKEAIAEGKATTESLAEETDAEFQQGVMVLPIDLTKGLEFDVVLLWKPDEEHYGDNPKEAKLLYVAITRALHELHLLTSEGLTSLLQ